MPGDRRGQCQAPCKKKYLDTHEAPPPRPEARLPWHSAGLHWGTHGIRIEAAEENGGVWGPHRGNATGLDPSVTVRKTSEKGGLCWRRHAGPCCMPFTSPPPPNAPVADVTHGCSASKGWGPSTPPPP